MRARIILVTVRCLAGVYAFLSIANIGLMGIWTSATKDSLGAMSTNNVYMVIGFHLFEAVLLGVAAYYLWVPQAFSKTVIVVTHFMFVAINSLLLIGLESINVVEMREALYGVKVFAWVWLVVCLLVLGFIVRKDVTAVIQR